MESAACGWQMRNRNLDNGAAPYYENLSRVKNGAKSTPSIIFY